MGLIMGTEYLGGTRQRACAGEGDIQCPGRTSHEKETMARCAAMLYPSSQMMPRWGGRR